MTTRSLLLSLLLALPQISAAAQKGAPQAPVAAPAAKAPAVLPAAAVPAAKAAAAQPAKTGAEAAAPAVAQDALRQTAAKLETPDAAPMDALETLYSGRGFVGSAAPVTAAVEMDGAAQTLMPAVAGEPKPRAEPPAPKAPQSERAVYAGVRSKLAAVAVAYNVVFSMPATSPKLKAELLKDVAGRQAVISDIDDTIAVYGKPMAQEMIDAVVAMRKSGKTVVFITDRPDVVEKDSNQVTAFDTLSAIPAELREGIYVGTNQGGKLHRYDAQGVPQEVFAMKAIDEASRLLINEAAAAVEKRLPELGAELKKHSAGPFSHSFILKLGTPIEIVKSVAKEFDKELRARGLNYEVNGKLAKNPEKDEPYAGFSVMNKSIAAKHVAGLLGLTAANTVVVGDSMYKPTEPVDPSALPEAARAAIAEARALSGADIPASGNETDRNIEKGVPGALTLSVGTTADPRIADGYVLPGKGPEVTLEVFRALAGEPKLDGLSGALILALFAAAGVAGWLFAKYVGSGLARVNQSILNGLIDNMPL